MFVSFFPWPRVFFPSALLWGAASILVWYLGGAAAGTQLVGFLLGQAADAPRPIGALVFLAPDFIWFVTYYVIVVGVFYAAWQVIAPHPWAPWSIIGTSSVLFMTYLQVQVAVATNTWYGPFYDLIQEALSKTRPVTTEEFVGQMWIFAGIAIVSVSIAIIEKFLTSHYVFRWRYAMNEHYIANWAKIRNMEGVSQRVQDDTMRFAITVEDMGGMFVSSLLTVFAFLPLLYQLSTHVTSLPFIGEISHSLVWAAICWALFGTALFALVGIKLPGLEFRNQRVEASYRKELVLGEDYEDRCQPRTLKRLFTDVKRNYFRLYFSYMYFNVARFGYFQVDSILPVLLLAPAIVAGTITFGIMTQIQNAFQKVRESFQYLANSWETIIRLASIYKRLRGLDAQIENKRQRKIEATFGMPEKPVTAPLRKLKKLRPRRLKKA